MTSLKRGGFHLISFATPEFNLPLYNQEDFEAGPKASVLIGVNGSNKSRVLSALIEELSNIEGLRRELTDEAILRDEKARPFKVQNYSLFQSEVPMDSYRGKVSTHGNLPDAKVDYWMKNSYWSVERRDRDLTVWKDGEKIEVASMKFPDRAIAVAHLPTDRFRFTRGEVDDFYVYLGLRQATNMTTTGALESKVIMSLVSAIGRDRASRIFKSWLDDLNLENSLEIEFGLSATSLFAQKTFHDFRHEVLHRNERMRGRGRERSNEAQQKDSAQLEEFWPFFQALREFEIIEKQGRLRARSLGYSVPFSFEFFPSMFEEFDVAKMIDIGKRYMVLHDIALVFCKFGKKLRFSELSSGEQQVLGTVIRFIAELGDNSVLVIDEPEVSLHPAWQRLYLPRLLETLKSFPQTHAIIATHSHFLVSDVSEKQASLTVASNVSASRFKSFDGDVYGRSPENILYRVFGIASTSNFYVERDLTSALRMISGVDDFDPIRLRSLYDRLQVVNEPDNEALVEILHRIHTALESGGN